VTTETSRTVCLLAFEVKRTAEPGEKTTYHFVLTIPLLLPRLISMSLPRTTFPGPAHPHKREALTREAPYGFSTTMVE